MGKPTPLSLKIGARIRSFRHLRELTQAALAERMGMDSSDVSRMEIGVRLPTLPTLRRFAKALRVGCRDLLDIEPGALPPELAALLAELRAAPPEQRRAALDLINRHLAQTQRDEAARSGGEHVV
jgi:transcriptional regulator with XRE-family HTH domain